MTQELIKEALKAIEKADKMVSDLCSGKEQWIIQIPARPDKDPDLVISDALTKAQKALKEQQQKIQSLKKTCSDMFIKKDNAVCDYQRLLNKLKDVEDLPPEFSKMIDECYWDLV